MCPCVSESNGNDPDDAGREKYEEKKRWALFIREDTRDYQEGDAPNGVARSRDGNRTSGTTPSPGSPCTWSDCLLQEEAGEEHEETGGNPGWG